MYIYLLIFFIGWVALCIMKTIDVIVIIYTLLFDPRLSHGVYMHANCSGHIIVYRWFLVFCIFFHSCNLLHPLFFSMPQYACIVIPYYNSWNIVMLWLWIWNNLACWLSDYRPKIHLIHSFFDTKQYLPFHQMTKSHCFLRNWWVQNIYHIVNMIH